MAGYLELLAQKAELDRQIADARQQELDAAIAQCRELIELFELTPHDVGFVQTQKLAARKVKQGDKTFPVAGVRMSTRPPLYRDPATGNTWNGHGRAPRWLDGHKDEFLIRNVSSRE